MNVDEVRVGNERLRLLGDFLARPIYAHKDEDGDIDQDITTAYNLAVEAALKAVRSFAIEFVNSPRETPCDTSSSP